MESRDVKTVPTLMQPYEIVYFSKAPNTLQRSNSSHFPLFLTLTFETLDPLEMPFKVPIHHLHRHKLSNCLQQGRFGFWIILLLQSTPNFRQISHPFDVDHDRCRNR